MTLNICTDIPDILTIIVIPEISPIPEISIIIQISSRLWFQKGIQSVDSRHEELYFLGPMRPPPTQKLESYEAS